MTLEQLLNQTLCFIDVKIDGEFKELNENKNQDGFYQVKDSELLFAPIANISQDFNGIITMPDITGKSFEIKLINGKVL